jgi:CRISPR-associated protein Cas6
MSVAPAEPQVVDVVFDVAGDSVPADYAWPLLQAIESRLPWFGAEPCAGIHPLKAPVPTYGIVLLAQRAKLTLRVPAARLDACLALAPAELDVAGSGVRIAGGRVRPLVPSATLSAQRVASAAVDAAAFEAEVALALAALAIECAVISGRRRQGTAGVRPIAGFALALHGLSAADSVRIQGLGIGGERGLGWGVLVPAKTIAVAPD